MSDPLDAPARPAEMAAAAGDRVFRELGGFVARTLRHFGVAGADIDDVSQEVLLTLHRRLPELRGREVLRTFVYRVCWRSAANYRRKSTRVTRDHVPLVAEPAIAAAQERLVESEERKRRLAEILDGLDPDKRDVFVLYEIEELSMREVVEVVGCPLQTGYSRLAAARQHVLEAFGTQRDEETT